MQKRIHSYSGSHRRVIYIEIRRKGLMKWNILGKADIELRKR
jgi:hypothetical protein